MSWRDHFLSNELSPPHAEALRQALWLAQLKSASIDFVFSLDLSAKAQELIAERSTDNNTALSEANDHLVVLEENARKLRYSGGQPRDCWYVLAGVDSSAPWQRTWPVACGYSSLGAVQAAFLGNTGIKTLAKMPPRFLGNSTLCITGV
ncbi:hypothetical protein Pr1d_36420 [Bythopirellula goksoeyrii]|uniref:Uncharacterized protein n=1 Tax=Bythopirellula goksoeyrii TaxID=1400387 RepID=A0A5B9QEM2_9BACT|nr:hypothetical protein Pr1d_36420 [Bythopirellula goksoeyrii]